MNTYITKNSLENNKWYQGESNYATVAQWNSSINKFEFVYNSQVYSVQHADDVELKTSGVDYFLPLVEITPLNLEVLKSGKLQLIKN